MRHIHGFLLLTLGFSSQIDCKRHWQIVPEEQPQPINIMEPAEQEPFVTYNDEKHRMTVIEDTEINACFFTNYDPEWKLSNEEKQRISHSNPAQTIRSPMDFIKLKAKVGDIISSMCKHRALYWLTRPRMPPKPQAHIVQHEHKPDIPPRPQFHISQHGHAPVQHHVPFHVPPPLHHRGPVHIPHQHHGKSALKESVPHKSIKTDSDPHIVAPGEDVADHYIVPPKKH